MPLPARIEILPLEGPVQACITVPGSKSVTNRALLLAALARGAVTLTGALWSDDTRILVEALRRLGFEVKVEPDLADPANRILTVQGTAGHLPPGGSPDHPLELFVGNAGTAARFLTAFLCLGRGTYRLDGIPRMRERPQAGLFQALRQLGCRLDSTNDRLPVLIHAQGPTPGTCEVDIRESSQFASALLLVAHRAGWQVRVTGTESEEAPYVAMTQQLLERFPHHGGRFAVEPDASSGSYFWAAGHLLVRRFGTASHVSVAHWPETNWQIDARFPSALPLPAALSRQRDLGDSIMTAIVLAPLNPTPVRFSDLGRLRLQECERVAALRTELTRCGARLDELGDSLTVYPSALHGATIETYDDHRMAMCFATLGLHVPGIELKNPACVRKTFPNFFQKLTAHPPHGLGARILEPATGRILPPTELLAS